MVFHIEIITKDFPENEERKQKNSESIKVVRKPGRYPIKYSNRLITFFVQLISSLEQL